MKRSSTGMNWGSIGDDREKPGHHRESIKKLNTSGSHREGPATTGAAPGTTGTAPGTTGTAL
ncbi:hypothetical protein DPMN_070774 [Dreissena polymorpha]|uniref:Uncharacterized protein n=1 Tax=Dreissena polymorpha TaxID=45954 RepID=A0A9D3Z1L7_DREPO|nr:hypothetical protein DPMN_070774 [Dreissena polymorpha]